jgi:hypothetical protein
MSCTKNPKRFLGISYKGNHNWKITHFYKFMEYVSDNFVVNYECSNCGAETTEYFVTHADLLEKGLTNKQIKLRSLK